MNHKKGVQVKELKLLVQGTIVVQSPGETSLVELGGVVLDVLFGDPARQGHLVVR